MQIFVTSPSGLFSLKTDANETVRNVKSQICDMKQEENWIQNEDVWTMKVAGKVIEDVDASLNDYAIEDGSLLQIELRMPGGMMIKVKTLTGKEIEFDIDPMDTVERIKERVEEKEGIPPQQQRLIFGGRQMVDKKTASDYNLEGGSTLHLILALRGGH